MSSESLKRRELGSKRGGQVIQKKMAEIYQARAEAARDDWGNPLIPAEEVIKKHNLSRNTLIRYLGKTRKDAVRERQKAMEAKLTPL